MRSWLMLNIFLFSVSAVAGPLEPLPDGYTKNRKTYVTVLSEKAAIELFEKLKNQKHIPFAYIEKGCFARATEIARIAEREKIILAKIYAEGHLRARSLRNQTESWPWHVAPVIVVEKGKERVPYVIDPALFDRLATVDEWKAKLLEPGEPPAEVRDLYYGVRFHRSFRARERKNAFSGTRMIFVARSTD